ncbi:hypothetical protein F5Y19DRAFT_302578 [Xylariaceae sp. FL1651]|nr:hypothetical protein F5Y19DRAFT_302578 [Xylariaceae sp. FL1651]
MQVIRRLFHTKTEAPAKFSQEDTKNVENGSHVPPSYEDSQHASLRDILQGAREVMPLLWPSSSSNSYTPTFSSISSSLPSSLSGIAGKPSGLDGARTDEHRSQQEAISMDILSHVAMTPCGDRSFLDRIRQFSDFYFTPYIGGQGEKSYANRGQSLGNSNVTSQPKVHIQVPVQEEQRALLQSFGVPYESAALVLCARVLEGYYATLGHRDSVGIRNYTAVAPEIYIKYSNGTELEQYTKTRLFQIAACEEESCGCCDYDERVSDFNPETNFDQDHCPPPLSSRYCGCGHPRISHAPLPSAGATAAAAAGISRLLQRYTNWQNSSYRALGHRSSTGRQKTRIDEIEGCGALGTRCLCPDYDKGKRTGRCARCGHYCDVHFSMRTLSGGGRDIPKSTEGGTGETRVTERKQGSRQAEWDLSWILIENAYLLLKETSASSLD